MLTDTQEFAINSTQLYTLDWSTSSEDADELEKLADAEIAKATMFTNFRDLGGLTVYFKESMLVAFYDYEQQRGTVFKDPVK